MALPGVAVLDKVAGPRRQSTNNFQKTGMVQGALLKYFKKSNSESRNARHVVNEIATNGSGGLPERCESPEIVYLGTFPNEVIEIQRNDNESHCSNKIGNASGNAQENASSPSVSSLNPIHCTNSNVNMHDNLLEDKNSTPNEKSVNNSNTALSEDDNSAQKDTPFVPKGNCLVQTQETRTESAEERERLDQTNQATLLPSTMSNVVHHHDENPSISSSEAIKRNVQMSKTSIVLPHLVSNPSLSQSPKLNVDNYFKAQKKRSHPSSKMRNSKQQKLQHDNEDTSLSSKPHVCPEVNDNGVIINRRRSSGSSGSSKGRRKEILYRSQDPVSMSAKDQEDCNLLLSKRRFKEAIDGLSAKLDDPKKIYPTSFLLSEIIETCVFGRASRDVHARACNYFDALVEVLPINSDTYKFYVDTFTSEALNPNGKFVTNLMTSLQQNYKMKSKEKFTLQFFKAFTALLEKEFESYIKKPVKISQPLIIILLSRSTSDVDWGFFLKTVAQWSPQSEEAATSMKWITIIAKYFENFKVRTALDHSYPALVDDIVDKINDRKDKDYGLQFLNLLGFTSLSLEVLQKIIRNNLPEFDDQNKWRNILYELSASLPATCESSRQTTSSLPLEDLLKPIDEFSKFLTEKVNMKGESRLHLAAGQKKKFKFKFQKFETLDYNGIFNKMKATKCGDINIRDNAMNTPLHDVCFHGNSDVLTCIWQSFTDEPQGPHRIDLLAQNHHNESALHNAVQQQHVQCIRLLLVLSQYLNCHSDLLRLRNDDDKTALDLVKEGKDSDEIKKLLAPLSGLVPKKRRVYYAGVQLPELAVDNIENNMKLQGLITYWRQVYDIVIDKPKLLSTQDLSFSSFSEV